MNYPTRRAVVAGLAASLGLPGALRADGPGLLDGADFAGVLAPVDGGRAFEDTLHFRDGVYWSRGCIACSFAPGAYTARTDGDAVVFTGALESPERGTFAYEGRVEDGAIDVAVLWRRERWYWTHERSFRFTGTRLRSQVATTLDDARARAAAPRAPGCTI